MIERLVRHAPCVGVLSTQKYNNTGDFVVGDVVLCYLEEIR